MAREARTTATLRETLLDTIDGVLDGSIDPKIAAQVSNLAQQVVKTADLEIRYSKHVSDRESGALEVEPGPRLLTAPAVDE